jgi:hypothetical protein
LLLFFHFFLFYPLDFLMITDDKPHRKLPLDLFKKTKN